PYPPTACRGRSDLQFAQSFGWLSPIRTDGGVRAARETAHTGARKVTRRRLEPAGLDACDRLHDHSAAALQVIVGQQPLAVLLETGRLPDAEDHLADRTPDPLLRVPER